MLPFHQTHNSLGNHTYNVYRYTSIYFDAHFHKNYEVMYVNKGQIFYTVNGRTKQVEEGCFAFCLASEIHAVESVGEVDVWIGVFSEDFIHEFKKFQQGKTGSDFVFRCPDSLTAYLKENLIKTELSDVFMIKSCLYALCSEYLRQIQLIENTDKSTLIVNQVVDYVDKNYQNPISLSSLARVLGYEYCYFSKIFNRMFAMRFTDYLNTYRFNEACDMLTHTDLPITDIAFKSGFQSIRSFNHIFKKYAGLSPKEYRETSPISPVTKEIILM